MVSKRRKTEIIIFLHPSRDLCRWRRRNFLLLSPLLLSCSFSCTFCSFLLFFSFFIYFYLLHQLARYFLYLSYLCNVVSVNIFYSKQNSPSRVLVSIGQKAFQIVTWESLRTTLVLLIRNLSKAVSELHHVSWEIMMEREGRS